MVGVDLYVLLRAAYKFIGQSLNATPAQLGSITLTRALVQALSSPLGQPPCPINRLVLCTFVSPLSK